MNKLDLRMEYHKDTGEELNIGVKGNLKDLSEGQLLDYAEWLENYIINEFSLFMDNEEDME
jgi:hypothetical protein